MRQQLIPSLERSRRLDCWFKGLILAFSLVSLIGLIGGTSTGRRLTVSLANWTVRNVRSLIGFSPGREASDLEWRLRRAEGIEQTGRRYRDFFLSDGARDWRPVLRASGMAPEEVLLRWANYDWTVVLSPRVFQADETGRAYRLRPSTRAFWTRNHSLPNGLASFFFLPDVPEVREALDVANQGVIPESFQTTNSWGCRGPEPDLDATVRGLVLGDSFMQGLFVADDQSPPETLARNLHEAWNVPVSILNTGHIGYSPEQYYFTLLEYFDRIKPQFVVLSVCPNDFGDAFTVLVGGGDFVEGKYWINLIQEFCRVRETPCLLVPVPLEIQLAGHCNQGHYPGRVSDLSESGSMYYLNPITAFTDEHLRLIREGELINRRPATSPLYNGHLGDDHFSRLGSALWGKEIGRRIRLILEPIVQKSRIGHRVFRPAPSSRDGRTSG